MAKKYRRYTVGWVCALPIELAAAQTMLDEVHKHVSDMYTRYTLGRIGDHNVVITCLPNGQTGTKSTIANAVVAKMRSAFRSIRFGLVVGVGGGVPTAEADIRLGDVVVSKPRNTNRGVVQYVSKEATPSEFKRTDPLNRPPDILLSAVSRVEANHPLKLDTIMEHASNFDQLPEFARQNAGPDVLFEADYHHVGEATCEMCSKERVVERKPRDNQDIVVHYGTIASGNHDMRDGAERNRVSLELGVVFCFETVAADLMDSFPCLVIRGICDYADSHKNTRWQAYAARAAAAYAKQLLSVMQPDTVPMTGRRGEVSNPR